MEYPFIEVNGQKITMEPPKARLYATIRRIQEEGMDGSIERYADIVAAAFRGVKVDDSKPNPTMISSDWVLDNIGGGELIGTAIQIVRIVNEAVAKEFERFPDLKNALEQVEVKAHT